MLHGRWLMTELHSVLRKVREESRNASSVWKDERLSEFLGLREMVVIHCGELLIVEHRQLHPHLCELVQIKTRHNKPVN